jgi:hypothetical protein
MAFWGATDAFDGRSNTAYKHWLQAIQPTAATPEHASFINEKVAAEDDGIWLILQEFFAGIPSRQQKNLTL